MSLGRLVVTTRAKVSFDADFTCEYPTDSRQALIEVPHSLVKNSRDIKDTDRSTLGNLVPLLCWVLSEGSISIFSICLPNVNYLVQRARHHGVSALFTRREYTSRSIPQVGLNPASIQGKGRSKRIENGGITSLAEDRLGPDRRGVYSVSIFAEQSAEETGIALGQVHMRQDVNVVEDGRWAPV